jgi:3-dehydroquinate synthase
MKFTVNKKVFNGIINDKDTEIIKSYRYHYEVLYKNDNLKNLVNKNHNDNDYIIIDKNVYNLDKSCFNNIKSSHIYFIDAKESNKTIDTVLGIIDSLIELKISKTNKILVIGGGITQDIGGTVSALYKRGITWWLIPTTLLSMTDSAIGAKTCLNRTSKNILGLFYAPKKILISNYFLNSLPKSDIISGLGEALKLSMIGGEENVKLFKYYYKNNDYINIIKLSNSIKKLIIEYDELEKNERRVLNYGHTCGHSLEVSSNYKIPHGIAVLFGMYIVNILFYGNNKFEEINKYILDIIPKKFKGIKIDFKQFKSCLLNDKKNKGTNICFVLLEEYGQTKFVFREFTEIIESLKKILLLLFEI